MEEIFLIMFLIDEDDILFMLDEEGIIFVVIDGEDIVLIFFLVLIFVIE